MHSYMVPKIPEYRDSSKPSVLLSVAPKQKLTNKQRIFKEPHLTKPNSEIIPYQYHEDFGGIGRKLFSH